MFALHCQLSGSGLEADRRPMDGNRAITLAQNADGSFDSSSTLSCWRGFVRDKVHQVPSQELWQTRAHHVVCSHHHRSVPARPQAAFATPHGNGAPASRPCAPRLVHDDAIVFLISGNMPIPLITEERYMKIRAIRLKLAALVAENAARSAIPIAVATLASFLRRARRRYGTLCRQMFSTIPRKQSINRYSGDAYSATNRFDVRRKAARRSLRGAGHNARRCVQLQISAPFAPN